MRRRQQLAEAEAKARAAEREAEGAHERAALLRDALDALPLGIVIAGDPLTEPTRNRLAAALASATGAEALADRAVEEVLEAARQGRAERRVIELQGPPPRTLVVKGEPVVRQRGRGAAVVSIEDVTEFARLESVRRDFVANVSHELRTPVGALGLLAEALVEEPDPEVVARLVARVSEESERARRIIDDLLDLSRIEAEGRPPREPVDLIAVAQRAVEHVRSIAGRRGVKVDLSRVPESAAVLGSDRQLVSAAANLVDNAVKYSDPGGVVDVEIRSDTNWTDLVVRDRGVGIPAADLDRIFERFYRVDPARSRETGGTGLGLAIVRHVAINHGGEVLVESREGEGSVFTLRLPTWE